MTTPSKTKTAIMDLYKKIAPQGNKKKSHTQKVIITEVSNENYSSRRPASADKCRPPSKCFFLIQPFLSFFGVPFQVIHEILKMTLKKSLKLFPGSQIFLYTASLGFKNGNIRKPFKKFVPTNNST